MLKISLQNVMLCSTQEPLTDSSNSSVSHVIRSGRLAVRVARTGIRLLPSPQNAWDVNVLEAPVQVSALTSSIMI
jgi:hypothetical protein